MCEPKRTKKSLGVNGCTCGCCECGCGGFARRFRTSEEEVKQLEWYRSQLQQELSGVEVCIKEMTGWETKG